MVRRTKAEAQGTRTNILDAAERVFHERGVAHASLEDVAAANLAKLRRRYPEGYSDEASVNREKS